MISTLPRPRVDGFVLVVVLMFLVVLTLVAVSSLRTITSEEKMAGAMQEHSRAFGAAEVGLRYAERVLTETSVAFSDACANGLCSMGHAPTWSSYAWDGSKSKTFGTAAGVSSPDITGLAQQPQYFIEQKNASGSCQYYEVTAKGWGASASSGVVLRELVKACS